MAKIIIEIEDTPDDSVSISLDFDPPVDTDEHKEDTPAHYIAAKVIDLIKDIAGDEDLTVNEVQ